MNTEQKHSTRTMPVFHDSVKSPYPVLPLTTLWFLPPLIYLLSVNLFPTASPDSPKFKQQTVLTEILFMENNTPGHDAG